MKVFAALTLFLTFFLPGLAANANPSSLYVELFQSLPRIESIYLQAPFCVVNPTYLQFRQGVYQVTRDGSVMKLLRVDGGKNRELLRAPHMVLANRSTQVLQFGPERSKIRKYYGELNVRSKNPAPNSRQSAGLQAVNLIDTFNYVASVVGGETTPQFGKEALKAQAVLVYTRLWGKGRNSGLKDTTDDMVYLGANYERPEVIDAVNEIDRCKLLFQGRPAQSYFHACCAGRTSKGTDIFGVGARAMTYLQSVPCNFCKDSPLYSTTVKEIPAVLFNREIADSEPKVLKSDQAKRIVSAEIRKNGKREELSGYQLWLRIGQRLGWDKAPGTRYQVKQTAGTYTIKSSGGGHGVGLCQWGAQGLAKQGKTYKEILNYYFPGTTVEQH